MISLLWAKLNIYKIAVATSPWAPEVTIESIDRHIADLAKLTVALRIKELPEDLDQSTELQSPPWTKDVRKVMANAGQHRQLGLELPTTERELSVLGLNILLTIGIILMRHMS